MKRLFTIFLFFAINYSANAQCSNLYIAAVIDGPLSGGTPKAVQLCASGTVADLSIFSIDVANNGGSAGSGFSGFSGSLSPGNCIWITNNATNFNTYFGFAADYTSGTIDTNGDDVTVLNCGGAVVDVMGELGVDGTGTCWEHLDGWAVSTDMVQNGGVWDPNNWSFSGINALDGCSTNATCGSMLGVGGTTACATVPVEFASFLAENKKTHTLLNWTTSTEINNDYFIVQHSLDGKHFEDLEYVKGNGTTSTVQYYRYEHGTPAQSVNYYRLKQVDYDGTTDYSDIVSVRYGNETDFEIDIYPTVFNDVVSIISSTQLIDASTEVYDFQGALVYKNVINGNEIDLTTLQTGSYILRIVRENNVSTHRIIKL